MRRSVVLLSSVVMSIAVTPLHAAALTQEIVSLNSRGVPARGDNRAMALTPDGRYVLFSSNADNLPRPGVTDPSLRLLYVRDLASDVTNLVSRRPNGAPVAVEDEGDISADGRYVAFTSSVASRLGRAVFVRDLLANETIRAAVARMAQGGPLEDGYWPQLSADGRRIAFAGSGEGTSTQVYGRDLASGRTRLLTPHSDGSGPGEVSWVGPPSISGNGRFIAFEQEADTISECPTGAPVVYDWRSRAWSCPVEGWGSDGPEYVSLSTTGRHLAWHEYTLRVTNLATGRTRLVPNDSEGEVRPSWSADGRFLASLSYPEAFPGASTSLYDRLDGSVTDVVGCSPADRAPTHDGSAVLVTCDGREAVLVHLDAEKSRSDLSTPLTP